MQTKIQNTNETTFYRKTRLSNLDKGELFYDNNIEFELVYTEHAIMIGLTVEEFDGTKRVGQFSDDHKVLVRIKNPLNTEANGKNI